MLHFLFVALLAIVHVESQAQPSYFKYTRTTGACRKGDSPERNAGLEFFRDRGCLERCNSQSSCTGYVLPKSSSNWCETYTSKNASGDGRSSYKCYMKSIDVAELPASAYRETVGACRKGEDPENNAGLKLFRDRDCQSRCNQDYYCTAYVEPVNDDKNWCETYTSPGAYGDGRTPFRCYMKMEANKLQNLCKADEDGQPKTCRCYNGYDATCRAITGEEDCNNANCQFVNGKCKGKAKGKRLKCKKTKYVTPDGNPMCSCLPGCTVSTKDVKQRVRRRRANKQRKSNFKCTGKAQKFD